MSDTTCHMSISLDGFVAGPAQSRDQPLGKGGLQLHGWHLGDHGLWCKHTNFENACRAPLILRVPGQTNPGAKTNALVEFVDVYPSLVELAGLPPASGLEGTSFVPLLKDPARPWKSAAFSQYPRPGGIMGYTMRTDRYRFTSWLNKAGESVAVELYDHELDPRETKNVADVPENEQTVKALAAQLKVGWRAAGPPRISPSPGVPGEGTRLMLRE